MSDTPELTLLYLLRVIPFNPTTLIPQSIVIMYVDWTLLTWCRCTLCTWWIIWTCWTVLTFWTLWTFWTWCHTQTPGVSSIFLHVAVGGKKKLEMLQKIKHIFHLVSCPPRSYEQSKKLTSLLMASPHHVDSVTPTHTNTPQYKYNHIILQIQTQNSTNTNTSTQI